MALTCSPCGGRVIIHRAVVLGSVLIFNLLPHTTLAASPDTGRSGSEKDRWRLTDLSGTLGELAGEQSYGINSTDFDNDGDQDIVVAFQSGGRQIPHSQARAGIVLWLENVTANQDADVSFRCHLIDDRQLTPKDALLLGDATTRTVIVPCYLAGETVLYSTSDGTDWQRTRLRGKNLRAPVRAVVADLDRNGSQDIVVTSIADAGDSIGWFRRTSGGDGGWQAVSFDVQLPPLVGVDVGDLDRDGDLDLVCASEQSAHPWILINGDGKGTAWQRRPMQVEAPRELRNWVAQFSENAVSQNHVKLADIDGDGDLDCVETSLKNGYVAWRENVADGQRWVFHRVAARLLGAYGFDLGDLDHDGRPDLVVPAGDSDGVYVFRNSGGSSIQWSTTRLGDRAGMNWANIVRLADLDLDGQLDILATDWGKKAVFWTRD